MVNKINLVKNLINGNFKKKLGAHLDSVWCFDIWIFIIQVHIDRRLPYYAKEEVHLGNCLVGFELGRKRKAGT
jgi:hypothetical protein